MSERLTEVQRELEEPDVWNQPDRAQALGQERAQLEKVVTTLDSLTSGLSDASDIFELAVEEEDAATISSVVSDLKEFEHEVEDLEFRRILGARKYFELFLGFLSWFLRGSIDLESLYFFWWY